MGLPAAIASALLPWAWIAANGSSAMAASVGTSAFLATMVGASVPAGSAGTPDGLAFAARAWVSSQFAATSSRREFSARALRTFASSSFFGTPTACARRAISAARSRSLAKTVGSITTRRANAVLATRRPRRSTMSPRGGSSSRVVVRATICVRRASLGAIWSCATRMNSSEKTAVTPTIRASAVRANRVWGRGVFMGHGPWDERVWRMANRRDCERVWEWIRHACSAIAGVPWCRVRGYDGVFAWDLAAGLVVG